MSLKHSFNNGLENKPENNQYQVSTNQWNHFNVLGQQQYQQNSDNQNYNQTGSEQRGQASQQYVQQPTGGPQQYSQQRNVGQQQYSQNQNRTKQNYNSPGSVKFVQSSPQYSQQAGLMQWPPQNVTAQQYVQQAKGGTQQYQQQNVNQQYANVNNWGQQNNQGLNSAQGNLQQPSGQNPQIPTVAERIANMQKSNLIKPFHD